MDFRVQPRLNVYFTRESREKASRREVISTIPKSNYHYNSHPVEQESSQERCWHKIFHGWLDPWIRTHLKTCGTILKGKLCQWRAFQIPIKSSTRNVNSIPWPTDRLYATSGRNARYWFIHHLVLSQSVIISFFSIKLTHGWKWSQLALE